MPVRQPVRFDDLVTIQLEIEALDSGRIHYRFLFLDDKGRRCAVGTMVTACARRTRDGGLEGIDLPETVRSALKKWKKPVS